MLTWLLFWQASRNQSVVKLTVVSCPPVVEVLVKRPDVKYQLGFSVQNGVVSLLFFYPSRPFSPQFCVSLRWTSCHGQWPRLFAGGTFQRLINANKTSSQSSRIYWEDSLASNKCQRNVIYLSFLREWTRLFRVSYKSTMKIMTGKKLYWNICSKKWNHLKFLIGLG